MPIFLQNKNFHKNNLFSYVTKQKKTFVGIMLTPLLAACGGGETIPSDEELIAQGYLVYHSLSDLNDSYNGTGIDDAIIGAAGNDDLRGGYGDDLIFGQDGDDTLRGEDQNDKLYGGAGSDRLYGGSGHDILSPGADFDYDYIDGGGGSNTLSYEQHSGNLVINMVYGTAYTNDIYLDEFVKITDVLGALNYKNTIIGNHLDNYLTGGNKDDIIEGGVGYDRIWGLDGDDKLYGNGREDDLYGGDGDDLLIGDGGNDILIGGKGSDTLTGGADPDEFIFSNDDVAGSSSTDVITDFQIGSDRIIFADLDYISSFGQFQNNVTQVGNDIEIALDAQGDHTLIVSGHYIVFFDAVDFVFS